MLQFSLKHILTHKKTQITQIKPTMIDKNKLKAIFKKAQTNAKARSAEMTSETRTVDDRFLQLKIGNTYHLRLLYLPVEKREKPFIELQVHRHFDPTTRRYTRVVCPTSEHLLGSAGFDKCPVCRAMSDLWKAGQAGDKKASEAYRANRRTQENYAVVYVVKDSLTENSNAGQVKILKYGFEIAKFLNANCLGIAAKGDPEPDPDEVIGFEAFDLENGRNLVIKVGKKDVRGANGEIISFPAYSTSFSQKTSAIDITEDDLPKIFKDLRFDESFFTEADDKALLDFYKNFVNPEAATEEAAPEKKEEEEEDVPYEFEKPAPKKAATPTSKFFDEVEEEDEEEEEEVAPAPKKQPAKKAKEVSKEEDFDLDFPDFE